MTMGNTIRFEDIPEVGTLSVGDKILVHDETDGSEKLAQLLHIPGTWSVSDTAPSTSTIGAGWFKSDTQELFIWTGASWLKIGPTSLTGVTTAIETETRGREAADTTLQTNIDNIRELPEYPAEGDRDGKSPTFEGDNLIWEAGGEFEQRVLVDVDNSQETQNAIIRRGNEWYATDTVATGVTPNQAVFAEYTASEYLGARYSQPPIGSSAQNSLGVQTTVDVGVWVYLISSNEAWTVELGADLSTKVWVRGNIDELVPGNGLFVGRFDSDTNAAQHIEKTGDYFYDSTHAELRQATSFIAGIVEYDFVPDRFLLAHDLTNIDSRITEVKDGLDVEEFKRRLGDIPDPYAVLTHDGYTQRLAAHIADLDSEVAAMPLWMQIKADINGQYQSLSDQSPQSYRWNIGDVLVAPPYSDDVI